MSKFLEKVPCAFSKVLLLKLQTFCVMISFYVLLTCKKNCANGNIVLLFKPLLIYLFIYLLTYLFIIEKGREEKERNINVREKRQLVASLMFLDQGQNLQPRHVSQLGTESLTFCFAG